VQDHHTTITPQEVAHIPQEETPSPASESSSVTTVGSSSDESSYPSADTPPSDVTINISFEDSQRSVEGCQPPTEDGDSLAINMSSSSETTPLPVEMDSPGHLAGASYEPFTPSLESEPAPASITFSPERTSPIAAAADSTSSHDEVIHPQTLLDCSFNPPTLLISNAETPPKNRILTPLENTVSNDFHPRAEDIPPPVQPLCVPPESSPLDRNDFALASDAYTDGRTQALSEPAYPDTKAVYTPGHLERHPSESLTQCTSNNLNPASIVPTQILTVPPHDALQVEAAPLPSIPEQPKPASTAPALNHTAATPDATVRPKTESALSPQEPIIPFTGNRAALTSGVLAPDGTPPLSERARSRVEVVRHPVLKPPPALAREPTVPIVKKPAPTRGTSVPFIIPTPSERTHPQVEAPSVPVPKVGAPTMPRIPSIATDSVPPISRITPSGGRAKVATFPPPGRPAHVPAGPRTMLVGKQLAPLNSVPVPDVEMHLSSRSRVKSHPKKMTTPVSQRRSMACSTQMNSRPAMQPSGLPSVWPEEHTTISLTSGYSNATTTFYASLIGASNLGTTPETRGGYHGHTKGPVTPPSAQVSVAISVSASTALNNNAHLSDYSGTHRSITAVNGPF
jgi:hypothetical protein